MRQIWLTLALLGCGCQSFSNRLPVVEVPVDPTIELPMTQTIKDLEKNALKQAAELTAKKQEAAACEVLETFLQKYPDRCDVRFAHAELLMQMKESTRAQVQYEEFLEHSQDLKPDYGRLLHVHGRLADIAQGSKDAYLEHLHRGIGLYFTARNFKGVGVGNTVFSSEKLLSKAQAELTKAHDLRPEEARPCWYLHGVYQIQGQKDQSEQFLRLAHQCIRQSRLTRSEKRGIELAMRRLTTETASK